MKSINTIQKEYLEHRLKLSDDYHHSVFCGESTKATLYNIEIIRLDKIILEMWGGPGTVENREVRIQVPTLYSDASSKPIN